MKIRLALVFALLAGLCVPLGAATFTVTNTNDSGAGSLRDAITQAAATTTVADDIVFQLPSLPATITLASRLPQIRGAITITGPGARLLTLQGTGPAPGYRCLEVGASGGVTGQLVCTDISFRQFGWTTGGGGGCAFAWANVGTMTFTRCAFRECSGANTGAACITTNHIATITDCEFSANVAVQGSGGAISCGGTSTTITNCTFTGNSVTPATGRGGAIIVTAGTVNIVSCTISGNTAGSDGGGVARTGGTVAFTNTILAGNTSTGTSNEDGFSAAGFMTSQGFNLIEVTAGMNLVTQTTDLVGVSPQLQALANNGGPTDTMALAATSPAIDAGSASGLTADQRGFTRPFDNTAITNVADGSDIGAFEAQGSSAPVVTVAATDNSAAEATPATDTGVITITLSPAPSAAVTLNFTLSGTASTVLTTDYDLAAAPGSVTLAYTGPGGTLTVPAGVSSITVTLTVVDDVSIEGAETATFTLNAGTGYTLGATTGGTVDVSDNDFPAASVAATDNTAAESTPATDTGTLIITFTPVAPTVATTLNFTMSGTADTAAGVDYTLSAAGGALSYTGPTGTISVPAGISSVTLTVTVIDDSAIEGGTPEAVTFTLNGGTGYTLGGTTSATVDITDNDVATTPTVTVAATDNAATEATPATDTGEFTLSLSPAPTSAVTIDFTMSGAADSGAGVDYTLSATGGTLSYTGPAGTITVSAGVTSVTLTLTPIDDAAAEGATPEDAVFTLNAGAGYALGTAVSDSANIADNDTPPTVTVAATDNAAAEATPATNTGTFTLTLSPAPSSAITLNFAISGSAATGAGVDYTLSATGGALTYTAPGGTLDVAAGVGSVTLTLTVVDDAAFEGLEAATFTLNVGTGYNVGAAASDTVNIADNDPAAPVTITTASLPGGAVGVAYSQPINSTGGAAPYSWTLQSGTLPPGLVLAASTTSSTTLSGTPTAAGTYNFTVQVADGSTNDVQAFSVTIATAGGSFNQGGGDGNGCSTTEASSLLILAVFLALAGLPGRLRRT